MLDFYDMMKSREMEKLNIWGNNLVSITSCFNVEVDETIKLNKKTGI